MHGPPSGLSSLPDNVQVEVCLYGAPNLPMSSGANAASKAVIDSWATKASRLATYDYALLNEWSTPMPVMGVAGTIDRAQYLASKAAINGGCQATITNVAFNPWNFYTYPRIRWNTNQTSAGIETEFFNGYFQEAATEMLSYYQAAENYQVTNDATLHYSGYFYGVTPGSFPLATLDTMESSLVAAESAATNWWVAQRIAWVRTGFDWIITQRGLTGIDLSDVTSYVKMTNSMTVDLEDMLTPVQPGVNYAEWQLAGYWKFWAQGKIEIPINFMWSGSYKISVDASAVLADGIGPVMNVYIGPRYGSSSVDNTEYAPFDFYIQAQPGVYDLAVTYMNAATGGARNLLIDQITIERQLTSIGTLRVNSIRGR